MGRARLPTTTHDTYITSATLDTWIQHILGILGANEKAGIRESENVSFQDDKHGLVFKGLNRDKLLLEKETK